MDRTEPSTTAPFAAQALTRRPPRRWELSTFVLLAATAATAVGSLFMLAVYLYLYYRVVSDGGSAASAAVVWSLPGAYLALGGYAVVLIAFIGAQSWWSWSTRRMLRGFGIVDSGVIRHWAKKVFLALVVLSFCCGLSQSYANPGPARFDRAQSLAALETSAAGMAIRLLALVLLLFGIWTVRAQVHQAVATARAWRDVAATAEPSGGSTPAAAGLSRATPAWAEGLTTEAVAAIPLADKDFWARVRAMSAEHAADLALLESPHESARRRWLLVSADGPRAAIEPGSLVTVFPDPPRPASAAPKKPPASSPGTEWFGLIEDAGLLHFQLVLPSRLPQWLAQARSAGRWGLYRTDDPGALTAVIPPPPSDAEAQ